MEKVTNQMLDPSAYPELSISKIKKEKIDEIDDDEISNIDMQYEDIKQEMDVDFLEDFEATGNCNTVKGQPIFDSSRNCEDEDPALINCSECPSRFFSEHDLTIHTSVHNGDGTACNVCNKKFEVVLYLKRHLRLHMKNNACSICSKTFFDGNNLQKHIASHNEVRTHACHICNKAFARKESLMNHRRVHSETYHNQLTRHTCGICNKTFTTKFAIRKHMRRHVNNLSFECKQCGEVLGLEADLKTHMSVHDKELVCNFCSKQFFSVRYLRLHVKIHMNSAEPYRCSFCDRTFKLPWSLSSHITRRHREKKHRCAICEKMFYTKCALRIHLVVHTGDKPYCCEICGKGFTQRHCVKKHMTLHTGKLPYACDRCPESFDKRVQLDEHLETHERKETTKNATNNEDVKLDITEIMIQNVDESMKNRESTTNRNKHKKGISIKRIKTELPESQRG